MTPESERPRRRDGRAGPRSRRRASSTVRNVTDDPPVFDAIVLAGGAARRLGGADKAAVTVGGRPLLDRVLDACR
ncbi:NTP transferase domain-containing protein, partial [Streptomyces harbinensis]|uniref:NTP transferase domain-containing protein n=1 Tax=Streptomyces harbinensis TaxID=1176198 RepID=UPI003F69EE30